MNKTIVFDDQITVWWKKSDFSKKTQRYEIPYGVEGKVKKISPSESGNSPFCVCNIPLPSKKKCMR